MKDWWFNVVPRATGCSTVLNNAAGNRQVAHARNLQAEILLCCTVVFCCRLLHGLHSGWGFLTREWLPAWQGLCSLELIGKGFHETEDINKIIMFKFIIRKYVKAVWNGLDQLERQNWHFFCGKYDYVSGSCARELSTFSLYECKNETTRPTLPVGVQWLGSWYHVEVHALKTNGIWQPCRE